MPVHTLSKNERLKSYKRIRILFAEGEKFRVSPLLVYFRLRDEIVEAATGSMASEHPISDEASQVKGWVSEINPLQMGVSVSSRYFKRAVDRNLLKRRIREAYRLQKKTLKDLLTEKGIAMDLFLVYIEQDIADHETIFKAMTHALKSLDQKVLLRSNPPIVNFSSSNPKS